MTEFQGHLSGLVEYSTDLFDQATVERMITDTKEKSKKQMLTFAAIGLAVVALVVLVVIFQGRSPTDGRIGKHASQSA